MYRRALSSIARRATASSVSVAPVASSSRLVLARNTRNAAALVPRRTFSSSFSRFGNGETDAALSAKLQSELQFEQEDGSAEEPEFLQSFKSSGIWTIEEKPGADEVALKRKFGSEEIKVLFSIADVDNSPVDPDEAAAADAEEGEEPQDPALPIRCAITVSKGAGKGALTIDAVAQDGLFLVDNIAHYTDENLALELTSEADWKRRGLYMGPAFDHLDETLQTEFEAFLEERGIDSGLALLIPELAEYKEQKEYVRWLNGVKQFVEA